MAPKTATGKAKAEPKPQATRESQEGQDPKQPREPSPDEADEASNAETNDETTSNSPKKRKQGPDGDSKHPAKAPRRSGRGAATPQPSQQALLNYMLSKEAAELCRPDDESDYINERGSSDRTYSSAVLNPFEELMSAVILSRPISHRLGLRSIRTVINDPYNFTNARAVKDAGEEKRHQALWDAKTQHKGKTADQLAGLADVVLEKLSGDDDDDGSKLSKTLDNDDVEEALAFLKNQVKGLGPTGLDIFLRRVQWLWKSAYPYVDNRTSQSLKQIGLPTDAKGLESSLAEHWSKLETQHLAGADESARKRRAFVVVLERAIGADLEGKVESLVERARAQ